MLSSLSQTAVESPVHADVIVVGAGLAGLFLATRLVELGKRVLVLESGTETVPDDPNPLNNVEMANADYRGALYGRFRGLGGTSSRWGGALLPYVNADLYPHPCGWHDGWHLDPSELATTLSEAELLFGLTSGDYEGGKLEALLDGFLPRLPKWPTFRNRNTAHLFDTAIRCDERLQVWTEATVTEIILENGHAAGVVAQNIVGGRLVGNAPHVILACGAIETTRLILLLDQAQGGLFDPKMPLGAGFHDHISAPIADLTGEDRKIITRLFGFRFVSGGMRNLRFELAPETRHLERLPAAFLHIAFSRDESSGFEGLRRIFLASQNRQLPKLTDLFKIAADLPWFARAFWWRFWEKRVLPPSGSHFEVHLVTEQAPCASQRISLSPSEVDPFGLPTARIDWNVSESDLAHFDRIADLVLNRWQDSSIGALAQLTTRPRSKVHKMLRKGGGIFHPAGTTRIGPDATTGVVDPHLCVHGVPGLRALATSVFPTVGGTSPSLALVQLALRMANDITAKTTPAPAQTGTPTLPDT
jgi:choline dehydrogenase-like flavoprotein